MRRHLSGGAHERATVAPVRCPHVVVAQMNLAQVSGEEPPEAVEAVPFGEQERGERIVFEGTRKGLRQRFDVGDGRFADVGHALESYPE